MRWLRLWTHSEKPPYKFQSYLRWLTTFICCGCAYGCNLTMLLPLSLTKPFGCYCQSRVTLGNKPQCYAVVEALDSFIMTPTSVSNICKVLDKTCICCGCTYVCILITSLPLSLAKILKFYQKSWMLLAPGQEITVLFGGWGFRPILYDNHIKVIHILSVSQPSYAVSMDASLPCY